MESELIYEIIAIFVIILANGFFALSEFSIIASRNSKLMQLVEQKKGGAASAERLSRNPEKFLATVQVGITLFGTLAGVFGGATIVWQLQNSLKSFPVEFIADAARPIAVAIVAIIITITAVVIGELVPKYLALSDPEKYARVVSRPVELFIKMTSFFSTILSGMANSIIKMFGIRVDPSVSTVSEEEINFMIYEGKKHGIFDEIEQRLIKSVFDFTDSTVRRAMTPRTDVVALNIDSRPDEIIDSIIEHEYSRFPVYDKNIDDIKGILYTKDIIVHKIEPKLIVIKDLIRPPMFVPDSMDLSKLLNMFQKQKQHIAVVLDEFGGTAGIITLEDILEELVGEIQDEYDEERQPLVKHSKNVVFAEGNVWPGEINKLMNSNLPEDKAETMAGLVIDELGRLPEKDEVVKIADMKILVLEKEENRLVRLKLEKCKSKSKEGDDRNK